MKNLIFSCVIFFQLLGCSPNPNFDKLTIIFSPAFAKPTTFRIDLESQVLELEKLDIRFSYNENFSEYPGEIIARDTVEVIYKESFKIPPKTLRKFVQVVQSIDLDTTINHEREVLDGNNFYFLQIRKDEDTTYLMSQSPIRTPEYEKDFRILDAFFDLAYVSIAGNKGISLVEDLHVTFSEEFLIRKVAHAPLEFRIGEPIRYCNRHREMLKGFLQNLPQHEPVIIDMRNSALYPCHRHLVCELVEKPNVYFYGNQEMLYLNEYVRERVYIPENYILYFTRGINTNLTYDFWMNESTKRVFKTKEELLGVLKLCNLIQ